MSVLWLRFKSSAVLSLAVSLFQLFSILWDYCTRGKTSIWALPLLRASTPLFSFSKRKWELEQRGGGVRVGVCVCQHLVCLSKRLPTEIRGMWIVEGPPWRYPVLLTVCHTPLPPTRSSTTFSTSTPLFSFTTHPFPSSLPHFCPLFLPPALAHSSLGLPERRADLSPIYWVAVKMWTDTTLIQWRVCKCVWGGGFGMDQYIFLQSLW